MEHVEMRFAGLGGQGILVTGDVLANAAGKYEGKAVCLRRAYGSEARGGTCQSELIIDANEVGYPLVSQCNFLLALSQAAANKFAKMVIPNGTIVFDPELVKTIPVEAEGKKLFPINCTTISKAVTGKAVCANIVALGAISVLFPEAADAANIKESIHNHFREKFWKDNEKAFDAGVEAARALLIAE